MDVEASGDDSDKAKAPPAVNESEGKSSMKAMHIFQVSCSIDIQSYDFYRAFILLNNAFIDSRFNCNHNKKCIFAKPGQTRIGHQNQKSDCGR